LVKFTRIIHQTLCFLARQMEMINWMD